jgi:hypothetical protein
MHIDPIATIAWYAADIDPPFHYRPAPIPCVSYLYWYNIVLDKMYYYYWPGRAWTVCYLTIKDSLCNVLSGIRDVYYGYPEGTTWRAYKEAYYR